MRILLVASKSLKEAFRQPRNLALTLGLPVVFMLIFGLAFGAGDETEAYPVAVVNDDEGWMGARYVEGLAALRHDDGTPLVRVLNVSSVEDAREGLESRAHAALLRIPPDFTAGLTPTVREGTPGGPAGLGGAPPQRAPPPGARVEITGDPAHIDYNVVERIVDAYSRAFGEQAAQQASPLRVQASAVTSSELTRFDRIAPGIMVFAILNLVPQAAGMLARESELGTLDRLRQSPTRAFDLLGGVALAQGVLAALSVLLMLLTARLMGFHNQGTYAAAYVIAMAAAVAVMGLGMVVASFARTQQEAGNLGIMVGVPVSFLSGAFFEIPSVTLLTWGDRPLGIYDVLPTTHAVEAMRSVLTFGREVGDVAWSLGALATLAALWLVVGVALYRRHRLAPA